MAPPQKQLAVYMSELSEEAFCAGWMDGLEFALWEVVLGRRDQYGCLPVTADHRSRLRSLSEACGGWIVYEDTRGPTWLPLHEWETRFETGRPSFVSEVDD